MTGYDIYKKSCAVLGYYDIAEGRSPIRGEAFTDMLNQILADLKADAVEDLGQEMTLTTKLQEACVYGCAMLLSVALKDSNCASLYSQLYNLKRSVVLSGTDKRYDVLPATLDGGV